MPGGRYPWAVRAGGPLLGGGAPPEPPSFSPSDLPNLEFWFDAADADTFTLSGSLIDEWRDKSGNDRNVSQTGAARPTLTTDGANDAVECSGAEFLEVAGLTPFSSSGEGTVFIVTRTRDESVTRHALTVVDGSNNNMGYVRTSPSNRSSQWEGTSNSVINTSDNLGTTVPWAGIFRHDGTSTSKAIDNFGAFGDDNNTSGLVGGAEEIYIGRNVFVSEFYDGFIMEIGHYSRRLTDDEQTDLMVYLRQKWGLQSLSFQVLEPVNPITAATRVMFYLPVEEKGATTFGDPIALTAARPDYLDGTLDYVFIYPEFFLDTGEKGPWYIRWEEAALRELIVWVKALYPIIVLEPFGVGFSKSGWGLINLMLNDSTTFERAILFDSPLTDDIPVEFPGSDYIFDPPFSQYDLNLRVGDAAWTEETNCYLAMWTSTFFETQMKDYDALMTTNSVPHIFDNDDSVDHEWGGTWFDRIFSTYTQEPPGGFLPSDIANLEFWFDASDAATILETGGLVDQWNDKSGNARNVTSTGGDRPTVTTDGGDDAIEFAGAQVLAVTGLTPFNFAGECTVFGVFRQSIATGTQTALSVANAGNDDMPFTRSQSGSNTRSEFDGVQTSQVNLSVVSTLKRFLITRHDSVSTSDSIDNLGNEAFDTVTSGLAQGAEKIHVGRDRFTGNFFNGFIMEQGYYSRRITDLERDDIAAYLSSKWGL